MGQIDRDPERFWSKVERLVCGCWIWHGTMNGSKPAYNVSHEDLVAAYRIAWEEERGPLPEGGRLLRTCTTKRCISPAHRFLLVPRDPS